MNRRSINMTKFIRRFCAGRSGTLLVEFPILPPLRRSRFWSNEAGSTAILAAVVSLVIVVAVGAAIDMGTIVSKKAELQARADGAAIVGAKTMSLGGASDSDVIEATKAFALEAKGKLAGISAEVSIPDGSTVVVTVTEMWSPIFAHVLNSNITKIQAAATSKIIGSSKICVLALEDSDSGAISLTGDAVIKATSCGVYSNSKNISGVSSYKNSLLQASVICSAGGIGGGGSNFDPQPTVDCPAMDDPLAGRAAPSVGACDYTDVQIVDSTVTLSPGVYCGGLLITGSSDVTLNSGVYVMKDGPLEVTHTASVIGNYVGFYLTGEKSVFLFAGGSSIELSAPKDGEMAGLLFFEDRSNTPDGYYEIVSENARKLVGTIYLPKGNFVVSSQKPVADLSDYTAIIANTVNLNKKPSLVLNTDYHLTDVPVPTGLTQAGAGIALTK